MNDIKQEKSSFLSINEEHFDPKHALHDYNSYDVKATPNHTHHLTWPHPLPGLTTSELPEPPLERGSMEAQKVTELTIEEDKEHLHLPLLVSSRCVSSEFLTRFWSKALQQ